MGYQSVKAYSINKCTDMTKEFTKLNFMNADYKNISEVISEMLA
jgi:hypothetical protein